MRRGVQELKHAAKLQEWSVRVAECRGSGIGVKTRCHGQGIALKTYYNWEREIAKKVVRQYALAAQASAGIGCASQSRGHGERAVMTAPSKLPSPLQQISALRATVERLNAIIEEKNQIILNCVC